MPIESFAQFVSGRKLIGAFRRNLTEAYRGIPICAANIHYSAIDHLERDLF